MKLKAKPGVNGIGLMGVEYVCDAAGELEIPDALAAVALENGFELPAVAAAPLAEPTA